MAFREKHMTIPTKGNIVTIYERPLTHEEPEGKAKLLTLIIRDMGIQDYGYWKVEFEDEPGIKRLRWVYPS